MKILIADDDATSRVLARGLLSSWGYEVVETRNGSEAWDALLQEDAPRLAILDWMMPGLTGPELCAEIRKRVGRPYMYLLLLTAREEKNDVVRGLEAGADDYLAKPFFPDELRARLVVGARILGLEDKLVSFQRELQYRATHDELTGLMNRAAISELLRREVARAQRSGAACGVLLADIDHFKYVNDRHGHAAGDAVLRQVATRLQAGIREYDAAGRYGGEEFLLVLSDCEESGLRDRTETIVAGLRARPFDIPGGVPIHLTISVGAVSSAGRNASPDSLVRAADDALYAAKRNGRNRAEIAKRQDVEKLTTASR